MKWGLENKTMKLEIEKSTIILIDIDQYWSILINSDRWSSLVRWNDA